MRSDEGPADLGLTGCRVTWELNVAETFGRHSRLLTSKEPNTVYIKEIECDSGRIQMAGGRGEGREKPNTKLLFYYFTGSQGLFPTFF